MKRSRWFALSLALCLLLGGVIVAAAFPHTVQYGDTLFSLARRYGTTVSDIAATNNIANPDQIYASQVLEIPAASQPMAPAMRPAYSSSSGCSGPPACSGPAAYSAPPAYSAPAGPSTTQGGYYTVQPGDTLYSIARHHSTTVDVIMQQNDIRNASYIRVGDTLVLPGGFGEIQAYTPQSSETATLGVTEGTACTRINFLKGLDRYTGSPADGTYVISEFDGRGGLASWKARAGDVDSGWIKGIYITFQQVHVVVTFYPADGGRPVVMQIVNPAPESDYEDYGWLARDTCHAIEIQYPYSYYQYR
jgi:LysM repeat protein